MCGRAQLTTVVVGDPDLVVPQFEARGVVVALAPDEDERLVVRAARFHGHGGPEVIALETVPDPSPRPGQVLVRVRACALNHLDLWQRRGLERVTIPFPHISGADVAGEVVEAPGGEWAPGTRVMLQPGLSCGRCAACLDGRDNQCRRLRRARQPERWRLRRAGGGAGGQRRADPRPRRLS